MLRSMSIRNQIIILILLMTLLPLSIIVYTAVKQQHQLNKDLVLCAGILLPVMLIMLGMAICSFKRNILNKISALLDATQKIAHGDLAARVPDHFSGGELGDLGWAFNDMAQKLQQAGDVQQESEKKLRQSEEKFSAA